jgi:hypothetical protein
VMVPFITLVSVPVVSHPKTPISLRLW